MKKLLFIALLTTSIFACKSTSVDNKTDEIKYKESVVINQVPRSALQFFDVSDSRCPEGGQCIWAGNVTIDLAISGVTTEGGLTNHVKMCLGQCDKQFKIADTLDYNFTGQDYRLILSAVNTYPHVEKSTEKEAYSIALQIEKK